MAYLFKNCLTVVEGKKKYVDVLVKKDRIERVDDEIGRVAYKHEEINADGKLLIPGAIDDQVHFREPGLTHKADIQTESRAAVAGGITSFMEMPNTNPQSVTNAILEEKYKRAEKVSPANYSFYLGATNDNIEEVLKVDRQNVCGVKVFMGSSTGNMLVDDEQTLDAIFSQCNHLIATHCETEEIVRRNTEAAVASYGEDIPFYLHPEIRSVDACYSSSSMAVGLAKKYGTRLHILHITTAKELGLFTNEIPLGEKRITSEACVHHLWFDADQYETMGSLIKCNPAIKAKENKEAILQAVIDNRIDVIATDHAPHTWDEKQQKYLKAPSGLPLVQHAVLMMLEMVEQGKISLEKVVEKMSGAVAECFNLHDRGYMREGYKADLVLVDPNTGYKVSKENLLYKCGWSPLEGQYFKNSIESTFVNGTLVYHKGQLTGALAGERLRFN
ncbi:dihydroorotase [bacterium]|nr:dihydroorotase [bacterium]